MRSPAKAAWAAMCLAAVTTSGFAAARDDFSQTKNEAKTPSIDGIVGKRLISIDGSMIALAGSEGGMSREIVAPNGAVQKMNFTFINDKLGTVADSRDARTVIGVFRMTDANIDIQYSDGSSEKLSATSGGGISVETQSSNRDTFCTVWYPEGHPFSLDDRKAAVAQYATRLGLGDIGDKRDTPTHASCTNASGAPAVAPTRATDIRPKTEAPPIRSETAAEKPELAVVKPDATAKGDSVPIPVPSPAPRAAVLAGTGAAAATAKISGPKVADLASAKTIDVRPSEVHAIDPPATPDAAPAPQVLASVVPATAPPAPQRGASSCLSVESDGSHWGFRNHCGYTVQFAYCLMSGGGDLAACKDGAVPGSVSANGFGALVADESLKETDVGHDFRWVACQGGAGEVIPRLDQIDPPVGRCVR